MRNQLPALAILLLLPMSLFAQDNNATLDAALTKAGANRGQIISAIESASTEHQKAVRFLVQHMPEHDLQTLKADFLLENVRLAFEAKNKTPWGKSIPENIFFNDVLPYANINEARDPWRKDFMAKFMPVVGNCKTAAEAAQKLNETVFPMLKVRYSTKRKRADQSPKMSIESGLASCTGLSILLANACRSVCVPARLAGIPKWANKPGNHTWVEVWDKQWYFTGAAEPSPQGLNHTWFQGDAALAQVDSKFSAIYAVSFRKTGTSFPLVWAPTLKWVNAVNVTRRYTPETKSEPNQTRLMVRVKNAAGTERVATDVTVSPVRTKKENAMNGRSRDESFDTNDLLTFGVPFESEYLVTVKSGRATLSRTVKVDQQTQLVVDFVLPRVSAR